MTETTRQASPPTAADTPDASKLSVLDTAVPPEKRAWRPNRRWWIAALIVIVAATAWYLSTRNGEATTTRPLTVKVELGDIENAVTAAGTLQPSKYVDVGAQVSGQLEKLHVDVGDTVKAGDLVAEIDATVQLTKVEASRANLEALQSQMSSRESSLDLAKARLERQTLMMAEDATSQDDYDNAVNQLASAESGLIQLRSQIEQARASLASDEATLGYSKIYAPIDGTVVSVDMKEGQTLNAVQMAPTIMRIADLSTMTVEAEVSEADVSKLTRGMPVYFTTLGGGERRWTGTLRQVLPTPVIENNVVLYTAKFDVENADGALLSDMTAQVFFVTASAHGVLKVPVAAVTYADSPARSAAGSGQARSFTPGQGPMAGSGAPGQGQRPSGGAPGQGQFPSGPPGQGQFPSGPPGQGQMPMSPPGEAGARPGMSAQGGTGARDDRPGRAATVRVVAADGSIETRDVRIGLASRISAEVLSGLSEGEEVVAGRVDTPTQTQGRSGPPFGPF